LWMLREIWKQRWYEECPGRGRKMFWQKVSFRPTLIIFTCISTSIKWIVFLDFIHRLVSQEQTKLR
jgi:hypothetical protein